jgi:hypothetical protein
MSTSAFIYWIGVPEWLAFGAVSVVACVAWLAAPRTFHTAPLAVLQGLIAVSITITHWVLGVAALVLVRWPNVAWRMVFARTRDTLALLALLSALQVMIYPGSGRFLDIWYQVGGLNHAEHSVVQYTIAFFAHTVVAPVASVLGGVKPEPGYFRVVSSVGTAPEIAPLTATVFLLWGVLLALGTWAAIRDVNRRPQFILVAGSLVFFFALHLVYGVETFLFSIQFAPFLVFIAIWGTTDRYRVLVRVLAVVLIVLSGVHNYHAFRLAVDAHNAVDPSWLEGIWVVSELTALTVCQ